MPDYDEVRFLAGAGSIFTVDPREIQGLQSSLVHVAALGGGGPAVVTNYRQRIYDSTAGWCAYTKITIDATPSTIDTTPNHTNNLVAATHEILGTFES